MSSSSTRPTAVPTPETSAATTRTRTRTSCTHRSCSTGWRPPASPLPSSPRSASATLPSRHARTRADARCPARRASPRRCRSRRWIPTPSRFCPWASQTSNLRRTSFGASWSSRLLRPSGCCASTCPGPTTTPSLYTPRRKLPLGMSPTPSPSWCLSATSSHSRCAPSPLRAPDLRRRTAESVTTSSCARPRPPSPRWPT
mmetsp:Transcript_35525/g.110825  ORF Transcript_35525/g.110825 Transcript_35525/m.110825 type:complete len:200 (+) Transcript_35525:380-979(+)